MTNLVEVKYAQTGRSSNTDALGMREMQAMVYAQRHGEIVNHDYCHNLYKVKAADGRILTVGDVVEDSKE